MFTKAYWKALAERSIASAAGGVVAALGADSVFGAIEADWKAVGSIALGAFVVSVAKGLAAFKLSAGGGPSLTPGAEVQANLASSTTQAPE